MNTPSLLSFLNKLEKQGIISYKANQKIQQFLDYNNNFYGKLFLVLSGIIGALFISAGIFAIISHNWDDMPKHIKGALSVFPTLIAAFFYYKAVFKHKHSVVWAEASTMFLFLMIGASIALVSQTYQLNGDFDHFMIVWLLCGVPLFYISRASGIALFYIGMSFYFLFPRLSFGFFGIPSDYDLNEKFYWFWIFLAAFIPHFVMQLDLKSKRQGPRAIYLGWILALTLYISLPLAFKGGWMFWALSILIGFMLIGQRLYSDNLTIFGKPFQFVAYWAIFYSFLSISNKYGLKGLFELENFSNFSEFDVQHQVFYFFGFITLIGITTLGFKYLRNMGILIKSILYLPFLIAFLMMLHYINQWYAFDLGWLGRLIVNFYILGFGISALIKGNKERNPAALFYGLYLICILLWVRYFDMEISFWLKGIIFIGVGGFFFLINYIFAEEVDTSFGSTNFPEIEHENEEEE